MLGGLPRGLRRRVADLPSRALHDHQLTRCALMSATGLYVSLVSVTVASMHPKTNYERAQDAIRYSNGSTATAAAVLALIDAVRDQTQAIRDLEAVARTMVSLNPNSD